MYTDYIESKAHEHCYTAERFTDESGQTVVKVVKGIETEYYVLIDVKERKER